jgi:ribosome-associated heat shock protein Hsp15
LTVRNEAGEFVIEVLGLSEARGPAAVAQALYRETAASREARARVEAERKAMFAADILPVGRPSKRDRRDINRFRGR